MKPWINWVGIKRDVNDKPRVWGIVTRLTSMHPFSTTRYMFWGLCGSRIYLRDDFTEREFHKKKFLKIDNGYKEINRATLEQLHPEVIIELEMQFVLKTLSNE